MQRLLFLMFWMAITAENVYASTVVIHLENTRKQPLVLSSASENRSISILAGKSADLVIKGASDFIVKYVSGELHGKVKYGLYQKLNDVLEECQKGSTTKPNDLVFCKRRFEKATSSIIWGTNYKLEPVGDAQIVPDSADELDRAIRAFSIETNRLFSPLNNDSKKFTYIADLLQENGVMPALVDAVRVYESQRGKAISEASQNILFIGDQGAGDEKAKEVAKDAFALCNFETCHYGISAGDNIYPKAPLDTDPLWQKYFVDNFVNVYRPIWDAFHFPFYMTLGNHDVGVDTFMDTDWIYFQRWRKELPANHYATKRLPRMRAQKQFTSDEQNPHFDSTRMWNMPDFEYAKQVAKNKLNIFLVSLNTNYFPGEIGEHGEPPSNHRQKEWLEKELESKPALEAQWRVVVGHHPIFSIGRHGVNKGKLGFVANDSQDMLALRQELLPVLCAKKVDFYLVGHDHHLEIDHIRCPQSEHTIVQVISGASSKSEAESPWGEWVPLSSNAFSARALYPEFVWGNNLNADEIRRGEKAARILGFSLLKLNPKNAEIKMIQSTKSGPKAAACYTFDRREVQVSSCDNNISRVFVNDPILIGKQGFGE